MNSRNPSILDHSPIFENFRQNSSPCADIIRDMSNDEPRPQNAKIRRLIGIGALTLILISWLVTLNRMGKLPLGRTTLPIDAIQPDSGYAVRSRSFPREILIRGLDVRLIENGIELRRDPLTTTESVREIGRGRFMIWNDGTILFSATDQSDPATNGRTYAISLPVILPNRAVRLVYLATALFCALWVLTQAGPIFRGLKKRLKYLRAEWPVALAAALACVPFFVLTARFILPQTLWSDEIYTLKNYVIHDDPLNPAVFYDYPNNHVLFNLILAQILRVFNMKDFAAVSLHVAPVRAAALIFPALTLIFITMSARRFGKIAAVSAPLLLATCLPFYAWTTQLRGYGLSMALTSALIYGVLSAKFSPRPGKLIFIAVITAALLYAIPFNAIFIGGIMLCVGWDWLLNVLETRAEPKKEKRFRNERLRLILAFCAGIFLALLWYLPILDQVIAVYAPGGYHEPTADVSAIRLANRVVSFVVGQLFRSVLGSRRELVVLAGLSLIGVLIGRRSLAAGFRDCARYFAVTLALLVAFCGVSGYFPFNRNLLPLVPLLILLFAGALAAAIELVPRQSARWIALSVVAIVLSVSFSIHAFQLNRDRPAYGANSLDQLAQPYFLSARRNPNQVFAYLKETLPADAAVLIPLPADFYDYELCEPFRLNCYPDYVGPDVERVLAGTERYWLLQTDWEGATDRPSARPPYAEDCLPGEDFARHFKDASLYSLYVCR